MQGYRPDRVVRVLTAVVSIAYFGLWVGTAAGLIGIPASKLFGGDNAEWTYGLEVAANVTGVEASVATDWGDAQLTVDKVRGDVDLPIVLLPWWLVGALWVATALTLGLALGSLHHLRRIFRRVRDGAPFDAENAVRLRWVGGLLLALALFNAVTDFFTALMVRRGLAGDIVSVPTAFRLNVPVVLIALVLIALAEIFRRGAELEHEQSLVV